MNYKMRKWEINVSTLIQHLEARNAKTEAWIAEDPSSRWAGLYTTDVDHWASMGINTVEDFERYELETYVYEATKDLYHYRPTGLSEMSLDELRVESDRLDDAMKSEIEERNGRETAALAEFNQHIADIQNLVVGTSFQDALRILAEAEGIADEEIDFYGYGIIEDRLGLKYGIIKEMIAA